MAVHSPKWVRIILLLLAALLPGILKKFVYRKIFGYQIGSSVKIGIAYLDCKELKIEEQTRLSTGVIFWQCGNVQIGKSVIIGPLNLFRGGEVIRIGDYSQVQRLNVFNAIIKNPCLNNPRPLLLFGEGCFITYLHQIDFTGGVRIGKRTILGGHRSSIWTHNGPIGLPVSIGEHCYLGSEIRIAPGVELLDFCIVGLGSVIVHKISESHSLIAGAPAKIKRKLTRADKDLVFFRHRPDLPEDNNVKDANLA